LPQSRHRKIGKAKKRPKGLYPASKSHPPAGRNRQARIVAIVVVLALAAAAVTYLIANRKGGGGSGSGSEVTTASGLKYVDTTEGTGAVAQQGKTLTVHYTGTLQNGFKFDSSVDKGKPYQFRIGANTVIKGWDEGLLGMKVGGKRKLIVPPSLGYGARAHGDIPPNSTLLFDVELMGVQ